MNNDRKKIVVFVQNGTIHAVKGDVDCTFYVIDNKIFSEENCSILWKSLTNGLGSISLAQPAPPKPENKPIEIKECKSGCVTCSSSECTSCSSKKDT